jgi:dUTP pyrophosphatase
MSNPIVKFVKRHPDAQLPTYGSAGAAGADVRSVERRFLEPGERTLVPTGLDCIIPAGYELQVRPRSGLALKNGVTVVNSPGTVDEDYRGSLGVILINHGETGFWVELGDRIAQIVVAPVTRALFEFATEEELEAAATERGAGGYGSTGVK